MNLGDARTPDLLCIQKIMQNIWLEPRTHGTGAQRYACSNMMLTTQNLSRPGASALPVSSMQGMNTAVASAVLVAYAAPAECTAADPETVEAGLRTSEAKNHKNKADPQYTAWVRLRWDHTPVVLHVRNSGHASSMPERSSASAAARSDTAARRRSRSSAAAASATGSLLLPTTALLRPSTPAYGAPSRLGAPAGKRRCGVLRLELSALVAGGCGEGASSVMQHP